MLLNHISDDEHSAGLGVKRMNCFLFVIGAS